MVANDTPAVEPLAPGFFLRPDYYDLLARLRTDGPVHECAPGVKLVPRYAEIRTVSGDPARFRSGSGVLVNDPIRDGGTLRGSLLHMDPPDHSRWRQVLNREFTARAVGRLEDWVRGTAEELLAALPRGEPVDLVEALSAPLPMLVIFRVLGLTEVDRAAFRRWSDAVISAADGRAPMTADELASATELAGFLGDLVAAKAADPGDDMLSALATAEVDGRRLTRTELTTFAMSLIVAGNETTRHLISGSLIEFAKRPDQRSAVYADPARVPGAVEECLRWVSPIQQFARTVTADTELAGVPLAAGDYVVMLYASGNRDEAAFGPTAGRFDALRAAPAANLAFGFGEHFCLGAALARLEARVLFEQLATRRLTYTQAGEASYRPSTLVRGPHSVPFVFD